MNIFVPNYYDKFKCIADKCAHNCCIGWEIDIDEETMEYYNSLEGELGEEIRANICHEPQPHFTLGEGDRCPFLDQKGLCRIISGLGEDALCEICTYHPRFRNFYEDFTEMGLGLCCEEAARIILTSTEPFSLVSLDGRDEFSTTLEEEYCICCREEIIEMLQQRDVPLYDRFVNVAKEFDIDFSNFDLDTLCDTYLSLERLDEKWTSVLEDLKGYKVDTEFFNTTFSTAFEQLCCYFIFRHLPRVMWSGDYGAVVKFALCGCYIIGAICSKNNVADIEKMVEYVRMFSAEVEYSEDNLVALIGC